MRAGHEYADGLWGLRMDKKVDTDHISALYKDLGLEKEELAMTSLSRPRVEFISTILQTVLNLGLLSLGLILVVFLGKETLHLADVLFAPEIGRAHV